MNSPTRGAENNPEPDKKPDNSLAGESKQAASAQDVEELERLYKIMEEAGLIELDVKDAGSRVKFVKQASKFITSPGRPEAIKQTEIQIPSSLRPVCSPLAGVFYRASSPSSSPFVKENDKVSAGSVLCIIEAMKMMNEIKAEQSCLIKKITAENGKTVQAGQELFLVEPIEPSEKE